MNNSHYPSLELCKKLTEIGFPETHNSWVRGWLNLPRDEYAIDDAFREGDIVCPSVMEMIDILPKSIEDSQGMHTYLNIRSSLDFKNNNSETFFVGYFGGYPEEYWETQLKNSSLPNALAEMVVFLVENDYITFDK